jgi:thiol:disulfide interchange protein DsbD
MRALVLVVFLAACAGGNNGWLDATIQDAAAKRKPLVIEFYARWCKPCTHFEQEILPDPRVQAALADVVFVRYDIETLAGEDAYRRCRGRAIPLVVGIDRDGVVRLAKTGQEQTADEFLSFLAQAKRVLR